MHSTQVELAIRAVSTDGLVLAPSTAGIVLAHHARPAPAMRARQLLQDRGVDSTAIIAVSRPAHLAPLLDRAPSPPTQRLMDRHWPGPLVLRLPCRRTVPHTLQPVPGTVDLCMDDSPALLELLLRSQHPLALWPILLGDEPCTTLADAADRLANTGWDAAVASQAPQAVARPAHLDLSRSTPRILRTGDLSADRLATTLGVDPHTLHGPARNDP